MSPIDSADNERFSVVRTPQDLALLVRTRRRELGLTQEALSGVTGLNRSVVSMLERGERSMTLKVALLLVQTLGMDIVIRRRAR